MAKTMHVTVVVAIIALAGMAAMLHGAEAAEYTVGDDLGWTIPPEGAATYAAWIAKHTPLDINVDSITFNFVEGEQDVAIVSKEDFDTCTGTHPIIRSPEPANIGIVQPGTWYFICTFPGHCEKGQKMITIWTNSSAAAPAPCPSSSTVTTNGRLPRKFKTSQSSANKHVNMNKVSLTIGGA